MQTLNEEPKIVSLAHALGIHEGDSVEGIKDYCRHKVRELIFDAGVIRTIEELEKIVCEKLKITITEIWSDADLDKLIEQYARQEKDIAFAALRKDLDSETFAALVRRKQKPAETEDHYVAVIDCRGHKASRRFFTRWHEIAHVLTLVEQLQLPLHRSTIKKDPIEKMMDIIAGEIGFIDSLFSPILFREIERNGALSFASVENIRQAFCPTASIEATLNACAARLPSPIIVLQAELGFKREEVRALNSGQFDLFPTPKPLPQLRVVSAMPNSAARSVKFTVHKNMRVPQASVIASVHAHNTEFEAVTAAENLNWWRSSGGTVLQHARVCVEAMKVHNRILAIVTPVYSRGHLQKVA